MKSEREMLASFRRTEAQIIMAVDRWSHTLGYPGGFEHCGRCSTRTQWGWRPECQPAEFARLP